MDDVRNPSTLTRQELYDLVWEQPISALAKIYQVKESQIRIACKTMGIPLPEMGYWPKLRFGKSVTKGLLPKKHEGPETITFTPDNTSESSVKSLEEIKSEVANILKSEISQKKPSKWITETEKEFKSHIHKDTPDDHMIQTYGDVLKIKATKKTFDRILNLFTTILEVLTIRGHSITMYNYEPHINIKGQYLTLYAKEKERRVENPTSESRWDKYYKQPTGTICIKTGERYEIIEFKDGKVPLEEQIPEIITKLEKIAEQKIIAARNSEIRRLEREEEKRKENEIKERKTKELKKFKRLLNEARRFADAIKIREYVNFIKSQDDKLSPQYDEWVKWAIDKADWYDPTTKKQDQILSDDEIWLVNESPTENHQHNYSTYNSYYGRYY